MSALNAIYDRHRVVIVVDTLAASAATPYIFTSKMYSVLHLKGIVCGTGRGDFIQDWAAHVNTGMLAQDMEHLDQFSPEALRRLATKL